MAIIELSESDFDRNQFSSIISGFLNNMEGIDPNV